MAQLCSQLTVPFNRANFHISDHPYVVYESAPSQHSAELYLGHQDVPGSNSSKLRDLSDATSAPSQVPFANGQDTGNFCDFGHVKFRFFFFFVPNLPFSFRLNCRIFRFFCFVSPFCSVFSRIEFGHITWAEQIRGQNQRINRLPKTDPKTSCALRTLGNCKWGPIGGQSVLSFSLFLGGGDVLQSAPSTV